MNRRAFEWPTLLLGVAIYALYLALVVSFDAWPAWLTWPAGALLLTVHGSFQHETIHGHPTRWPTFNRLLGFVPISVWLPYHVYETTHLAHHRSDLTVPENDPESFYMGASTWSELGRVRQTLLWSYQTLLGRMLFGPLVMARDVWLLACNRPHRVFFLVHVGGALAVLYFATQNGVPLTVYVFAWVYPSMSLTALRSFAEHRASRKGCERSAIVETNLFFQALYLNNNLHEIHHRYPQLPWYGLPKRFRPERQACLERNGRFYFSGYRAVAASFLFRPRDRPFWDVS